MQYEPFSIPYKSVHPGTDSTQITFYDNFPALFESLMAPIKAMGIDGAPVVVEEPPRRVFVTDTTVSAIPEVAEFLSGLDTSRHAVCVLGAGETHKTVENVLAIVKAALDAGMQRSCCFTGIGGGVITDMTAFAASVFKRGAKCELVPTTLLAMVDASIGGKTGCDFGGYKNMIGTFFPARRIFMASPFLRTLPEHEFRSGLAEAAKTAMLYAPKLFQIMSEHSNAVLSRDEETLMQIIIRSAMSKSSIVEQDLMETGIRMQLNLGHTFAHALESVAGLGAVTHGEAVAWGLGRMVALSTRLGLCEESYETDIKRFLATYGWCTEARHPAAQGKTAEDLLAAMKQDKKNGSAQVRVILQKELNCTVIQEAADADILAVLTD